MIRAVAFFCEQRGKSKSRLTLLVISKACCTFHDSKDTLDFRDPFDRESILCHT
jgi:hypothetical protein